MNEWGITFGEQGCGLSTEASATKHFSCLCNRRSVSGAIVTLGKGGDQLALDHASSGVIKYIGGRIRPIKSGRRSSSYETESSANFYGTVREDPTCSS